jgi:hypothetical protein
MMRALEEIDDVEEPLQERRRFELVEEKLTTLEALELAAEALREVDGPRMAEAAKMMDKKASRLRARQAESIARPAFCLCGNGRKAEELFCPGCMTAIPMRLWLDYHTARSRDEMAEAMEEIRDFVLARGSKRRGRR